MICRDQQHVAPATVTNQQPKAREMGDQLMFRYPSLTLITGTLIAMFRSPDSLTTLPGLLQLLVLWLRMHHVEVLSQTCPQIWTCLSLISSLGISNVPAFDMNQILGVNGGFQLAYVQAFIWSRVQHDKTHRGILDKLLVWYGWIYLIYCIISMLCYYPSYVIIRGYWRMSQVASELP